MVTIAADSRISFLIVVALKEEFEYVVADLGLELIPGRTEGQQSYYLLDLPLDARRSTRGAVAFMGNMTNELSHPFTRELINDLHPKLVISLGISGSLKRWVRLGDVVVASATDNYVHRGKAVPAQTGSGWTIVPGGDAIPTSHDWLDLSNNASFRSPALWNAFRRTAKSTQPVLPTVLRSSSAEALIDPDGPRVHTEHVASGPFVGAAREFIEWLGQSDRNFFAMDMESWGVAKAAHTHPDRPLILIVRGISDPSDELKSLLEEVTGDAVRKWALGNALRFLHLLLRISDAEWLTLGATELTDVGFAESVHALHEAIKGRYLGVSYRDESFLTTAPFDAHAKLFGHIAEIRPGDAVVGNLFETVLRGADATGSTSFVEVEGPAGSGKTSFLNVLYWFLHKQYLAGNSAALPVYINLHTYNTIPTSADQHSGTSVVSRLQNDLAPLRILIERDPAPAIILIVDGDDEYARHQHALTTSLLELLRDCPLKRIIGLRSGIPDARRRTGQSKLSIYLRSLAPNDPALALFVADFCTVFAGADSEGLRKHLLSEVEKSHLPEIDFFTLALLRNSHGNSGEQNLATLLQKTALDFVEQRRSFENPELILNEAAAAAFQSDQADSRSDVPKGLAGQLVDLHPRVRDYLAAQHVIDEMLKLSRKDTSPHNVLNHVYQYRINRLCKELIAGKPRLQEQLIAAIRKVLESESAPNLARAHACYLAGRVDNREVRDEALTLLRNYKKKLADVKVVKGRKVRSRREKDRVTLLVMRTVSISLAYLGDPNAGSQYVLQLLSDSRQDRLNRGFHLDYYGDQEFSRTATNLVSDDAGRPCPRTFDQLRNRLLSDRDNPIYEIELQTLCSLAQHRHRAGTLERTDAEMVRGVIDYALRKKRTTTSELRSYIRMVEDDLAVEPFQIARVYDTFHRVKIVPRSGWRARGLLHGETVADHMYSAYLLGLLFLPDTWNGPGYPGYSKLVILQMLLCHDLAEAVIGDLLPHQKTPNTDRQEARVYEKLSMSGTYEGLARTQIGRAWQEFRGRQSTNAKIAHELDKLENLVQLWVYRIMGSEIPGYDEWESNLRDEIISDPGTQILKHLEDYYLPRLSDPTLGLMMPPPPPEPDPSSYM